MSDASLDYWRLKAREERKSYKGADALVFSLHGRYRRRQKMQQKFLDLAQQATELAQTDSSLADDRIRTGLKALRGAFLQQDVPDDALVTGLSYVALGARRVLGLDPYPVQLAAAASLFHGYLAEMATGEGKTLTVSLAATLMGSTGHPCHVFTANDYLASRDCEELREFYQFFGLEAAAVTGDLAPPDRPVRYQANITYTTPKEALADFLRDRLALGAPFDPTRRMIRQMADTSGSTQGAVMRGLHFAIVDEADSVLIDEAVTPLIISQQVRNQDLERAVLTAKGLTELLEPGRDYDVDFKFKDILIRDQVADRLFEHHKSLPAVWHSRSRFDDLIRTALVAREFYLQGTHYVIREDKIELIDEFTGRIMEHRTWQQGLHQAVEAKEGIEITPPNESMASMSFQRFFRCFPRLSGLSGTAYEAKEELWQIYHLPVLRIPTHRPLQRKVYPPQIFSHREQKWEAIIREVHEHHQDKRPILIGTRSVENSQLLAERLKQESLPFELLNAVHDEREAEIVAKAGQAGSITIATNMAGRGTDIKLGPGVAENGGLYVIATDRHESGRIDRQLIGRSGRQGDPGGARFIICLEDDLVQRFLPQSVRKALYEALDQQIPGWVMRLFNWAQWTADRMAFQARKQVLKHDTWLDENLSFSQDSTSV
ncbi:MAG: DEAD/DEAH box helicase [Verrucomicrobiota bacterium]